MTGSTTISTPANHVNGQVDVLLPASIDPATDCTTSKCHSDGNLDSVTDHAGTANPKNNTVAWTTSDVTPGTFNACDKCHGDDPTDKAYPAYADGDAGGPDANSHNRHVGASGFSCEECHASTTADGTSVIVGGTHVDQTIDVGSAKVTAWDGTTCSAAACHGVDTPQWGGTVVCGSCHASNNTLAQSHPTHYDSAAPGDYTIETNSSTSTNYLIQCGVCHSTNGAGAITHGGGRAADAPTYNSAEVNFDGTVASGDFTRGLTITNDVNGFEYSDATCENLYCHGNFGGNGNNDTVATPTWGSAASGACGTCHDVDSSAAMDGGSHSKHVKVSGIDCDFCHGATAVNAAGGIADKSLHVNKLLNWELDATKNQLTASSTYDGTNAGTRAEGDVGNAVNYASCAAVYCHSDVQTVPPGGALTYSTPTWGGAA
ncbi:MAG: CxxxxCH/CxxCH domain c-type cytochrome, partial [Planctomycetota bacterium]